MNVSIRARVLAGLTALAFVLGGVPVADAKSRSGFGSSKSYSSSSSKRSSSSYSSSRSSSRSSSFTSSRSSDSGSKKPESYASKKRDTASTTRSYSAPKQDTSSQASSERRRSGFTSGYRSPSKDSSAAKRQADVEQRTVTPAKPKTGFGSSTTAKVAAGTALGAALYSASESQAATETYHALQAEQASGSGASTSATKTTSSASTAHTPASTPTVYRAPEQDEPVVARAPSSAPREERHYATVRESDSGLGDLVTGYLLGRALSADTPHTTVSPAATSVAQEAVPTATPQVPVSNPASAAVPAKSAPQVGESGNTVIGFFLILPLLLVALFALHQARRRRIDAATPTSNYSL